jgi:glycosyltransferase involved in cell wall biosynthesis
MKILQITNSFHPVIGGQEKVVLEISKGLVSEGHKVTVLTTDYMCESGMPIKDKVEGLDVVRLKNKYWLSGYGYSPEGMSWLRKNYKNFDIVHLHGYNRHLPEFALNFLYKKKPTVFSPHGFIHTKKNNVAKKIHDFTIGRFLKKASVCTALTKLDFNEYAKLGVKKDDIIEIPNGVDVEKYTNPNKKGIEDFKKKHNLDRNTILYVGRIHESKGLQYVIESIKDIDCKLLIVGPDGGYRKVLRKKAEELKILDKIIFLGRVSDEDLILSYFSSDLFVLFSEWEGFGIVAIEAMAAGLPVISSDRGALPFLVKNDFNGEIVEFKNIVKLREAIVNLVKDKKKILLLGQKAKRFSGDYSWEKIVKQYENLYKSLIMDF